MSSPLYFLIPAAIAIIFGIRYYRLKRGLADLAVTLAAASEEEAPIPPAAADIVELRPLCRTILNTVAEAALIRDLERKTREFQEALLNEIEDAIFILDRNREIRFVNRAARQLFPSDQPYQSRAFLDVCRNHRVYDTLDLAEEIGAKVSDNISLRVAGEEKDRLREITLLVEAEPLSFDRSSGNAGSWVLLKDITRELETEQIRRDFVANASHELRTPLSIINGYLETMDDPGVKLDQPVFRRALGTMRKHGERIARIVDDMLTISKLESASELLNREPFDLIDCAEDIIGQLHPLIDSNHARVAVVADPDIGWMLVGDRFYWDQIFFNLIDNALKQNSEPGLRIQVEFVSDGGRYVIRVVDDGIGIPAADIPLVFKRFYRVQKHHAQTQVKGTGLGLSIVKRAVEAHHGKIDVESRPGVRTAFTITVPQSAMRVADSTVGRDEAGA